MLKIVSAVVLMFIFVGVVYAKNLNALKKNGITVCYPGWKLKSLAFSYDDGTVADRQLVGIFNKYGMKGTFHIPSARLKTKKNLIAEEELNTLYKGHEVSGHGANHLALAKLPVEKVEEEIKSDISELKRITGKKIIGYAYPYGSYSKAVVKVLKDNGLIYARTVGSSKNFELPKEFLLWSAYSHHNRNIVETGKKYLESNPEKMSVLLIWGHSYEFSKYKNWNVIEDFCAMMSGKDDIYYATMSEIASYVQACRKLKLSLNGKILKNNTDREIFIVFNDKKMTLKAGAELRIAH